MGKNSLLGLSGRLYIKGGDRQSPVDVPLSEKEQTVIYDESRAFEDSTPAQYRLDISATCHINKKNCSHTLAIQLLNALGSPTLYNKIYDYTTLSVREDITANPFPSISWKIEF